jgi:Spy/CpxP family protein refolding chaperone
MTIKRMTRWTTAMTVAGAFVIGGASLAMSQQDEPQGRRPRPGMRGPGMPGPDGRDFMQWRMMRRLDLTEEQRTQIQELRKAHFEQTKGERDKLQEAQRSFHDAARALEDGVGSEDGIYAAAEELARAQAALAIARAHQKAAMMEILTEAQQEKLKELRAEMEEYRKERMERRSQRGRPQWQQPIQN